MHELLFGIEDHLQFYVHRYRARDEIVDGRMVGGRKEQNRIEKQKRRKQTCIFLAVTLVLVIALTLVNWGIVTSWGSVKITRLTSVGRDGTEFSALLYVPAGATDANPAPAIINFHGNAGNARNHESWAVEFQKMFAMW